MKEPPWRRESKPRGSSHARSHWPVSGVKMALTIAMSANRIKARKDSGERRRKNPRLLSPVRLAHIAIFCVFSLPLNGLELANLSLPGLASRDQRQLMTSIEDNKVLHFISCANMNLKDLLVN